MVLGKAATAGTSMGGKNWVLWYFPRFFDTFSRVSVTYLSGVYVTFLWGIVFVPRFYGTSTLLKLDEY